MQQDTADLLGLSDEIRQSPLKSTEKLDSADLVGMDSLLVDEKADPFASIVSLDFGRQSDSVLGQQASESSRQFFGTSATSFDVDSLAGNQVRESNVNSISSAISKMKRQVLLPASADVSVNSLAGQEVRESNGYSTSSAMSKLKREILLPPSADISTSSIDVGDESSLKTPSHSVYSSNPASADSIMPNHVKSRIVPSPAAVETNYFQLPTRKWIERSAFCDIPISDPLAEPIQKAFTGYFSTSKPTRHILSLEEALALPDPYKALVDANSWRSLARLARNDIIGIHPLQVDAIMRLWLLRWWALSKLCMFDIIQSEVDGLNAMDPVDMNFEDYPGIFADRTGPMVSFELVMFLCTLPSKKGIHHESINRMHKLLFRRFTHSNYELDAKLRARVVCQMVNVLLAMQDYVNAALKLESIAIFFNDDPDIWSAIGRIYLQLGNIPSVHRAFLQVEKKLDIYQQGHESVLDYAVPESCLRPDLVMANRAFLLISQGKFELARGILTNLASSSTDVVSVNNIGICHLYLGSVVQASNFLETIVNGTPHAASWEPLISNLALMYDLMERSADKKRRMVKILSIAVGDNFNGDCIKL